MYATDDTRFSIATRGRRGAMRWLLALAAWLCTVGAAGAQPLSQALQALSAAAPSSERAELQRLYASGAPLWLDATGRPLAATAGALALLASAGDDGLEAADYRVDALAVAIARLADADAGSADLAALDVALSASVLRYLRELRHGRVPAQAAGYGLPAATADPDLTLALRDAVARRQLAALAASRRPPLPQYARLRAALPRLRALAAEPDEPLPVWPTLRPGAAADGLDRLQRQLLRLGDLAPADAQAAPARYDGALIDAVRRLQRRHGLADDGVLGKATQAALAVPLRQRVRQLELAMERLRWLPRLDRRFVGINIPMFRLWAAQPGEPPLEMAVIVGRALDTRTPVFGAELTQVVFRPYWNVPRSIVRSELLAPIRRDPSYLARHDMEIVRGGGDDAQAVPPTPDNIARLATGTLRLRQRPGPSNALGPVKFVFPNTADVYLHGTPAPQLFARTRRDFSHGCVRVEDPAALAEWVLRDAPTAWPRERVDAALQGEHNRKVTLARPLPVLLYYVTALVLADGALHFADDLYGHDAQLERALAAR
jgi:murein L,D-transpeptidase YcbB/YkuD